MSNFHFKQKPTNNIRAIDLYEQDLYIQSLLEDLSQPTRYSNEEREIMISKVMSIISDSVVVTDDAKAIANHSKLPTFAQGLNSDFKTATDSKSSSIPKTEPISREEKLSVKGVLLSTALCAAAYFILPTFSAQAFDLAAGMTAIVDPFVKAVNDHYGKVILILGAGGAVLANGDMRTRAYGFGIGSGLAGAAMLAVKTTLGVA